VRDIKGGKKEKGYPIFRDASLKLPRIEKRVMLVVDKEKTGPSEHISGGGGERAKSSAVMAGGEGNNDKKARAGKKQKGS